VLATVAGAGLAGDDSAAILAVLLVGVTEEDELPPPPHAIRLAVAASKPAYPKVRLSNVSFAICLFLVKSSKFVGSILS
jgi:hypothetical protein